jgi:nicotinamide mononucleotide adenylyltransferase
VRLFLRRGLSVHYLLPAPVVDYIEEHGLYQDDNAEKGKGKESERDSMSMDAKKDTQC